MTICDDCNMKKMFTTCVIFLTGLSDAVVITSFTVTAVVNMILFFSFFRFLVLHFFVVVCYENICMHLSPLDFGFVCLFVFGFFYFCDNSEQNLQKNVDTLFKMILNHSVVKLTQVTSCTPIVVLILLIFFPSLCHTKPPLSRQYCEICALYFMANIQYRDVGIVGYISWPTYSIGM